MPAKHVNCHRRLMLYIGLVPLVSTAAEKTSSGEGWEGLDVRSTGRWDIFNRHFSFGKGVT